MTEPKDAEQARNDEQATTAADQPVDAFVDDENDEDDLDQPAAG